MQTNVKAVELRDLWRRYKTNDDQRARERLVVAYSPLVKYVAGRMASGLPAHVEEADLISYGLVGLISAIERFDLWREIRFETYAITRIKGAIIDELRSMDWVPRSVRARAREIERANAKLEDKLQRAPTDEEMADELDLSVDEFHDSLLAISNSSVAALDELWAVVGRQRRPGLAARHDPGPHSARPGAGGRCERAQGPHRRRDRPPARAREARDRPLLLREPDAARDRRGARRDRVAHLPAAHQGGAAAAVAAGRPTTEPVHRDAPAAAGSCVSTGAGARGMLRRSRGEETGMRPARTGSATSPSSATAVPARPRCTRRCSSRPARSTGSAP